MLRKLFSFLFILNLFFVSCFGAAESKDSAPPAQCDSNGVLLVQQATGKPVRPLLLCDATEEDRADLLRERFEEKTLEDVLRCEDLDTIESRLAREEYNRIIAQERALAVASAAAAEPAEELAKRIEKGSMSDESEDELDDSHTRTPLELVRSLSFGQIPGFASDVRAEESLGRKLDVALLPFLPEKRCEKNGNFKKVALSCDGNFLATIEDGRNCVSAQIFDANTGSAISPGVHIDRSYGLRFCSLLWSRDGKKVAFRGEDDTDTFISIFNVDEKCWVRDCAGGFFPIRIPRFKNRYLNSADDISWSYDGTILAIAGGRSQGGSAIVHCHIESNEQKMFFGSEKAIELISFSPQNYNMVVVQDGLLTIYTFFQRRLFRGKIEIERGRVAKHLFWAKDGNSVSVVYRCGKIATYQIDNNSLDRRPFERPCLFDDHKVGFFPPLDSVFSFYPNGPCFYDSYSGDLLARFEGEAHCVSCAEDSLDFVVGTGDKVSVLRAMGSGLSLRQKIFLLKTMGYNEEISFSDIERTKLLYDSLPDCAKEVVDLKTAQFNRHISLLGVLQDSVVVGESAEELLESLGAEQMEFLLKTINLREPIGWQYARASLHLYMRLPSFAKAIMDRMTSKFKALSAPSRTVGWLGGKLRFW